MLPEMLKAIQNHSDYYPVIAGVSSIDRVYYERITGNSNIPLIVGNTYGVLKYADAAIVTSGTATLEAALLNTPLLVCYKGNPISHRIARMLIKVKYISLVNLILNKPLVKELIQDKMKADTIAMELEKLLYDISYKEMMIADFNKLRSLCGNSGASHRIASKMVQILKDNGTV